MKTMIAPFCIALALAACANPADESVQDFVARAGAGMRGDVAPIPAGSGYVPVPYTAKEMRDPFNPGTVAPRPPKPDTRAREPLEAYALESLRLTGIVESGGVRIGLVRSPDGLLHQVRVGSYLGLASGRVV